MLPWVFRALTLGGLLLAAGCSKESELMPVSGTVTLDGKPVSGMIVTFAPEGETDGNGALGYVDEKGHFTLRDARGEPGAHAGQYRISFYPALKPGMPVDDPAGVVAPPRGSGGLPSIYLDGFKSPVVATIPPGGATFEVLLTESGQGAAAKAVAARE